MSDRLYRRGDVFYGQYYTQDGRRVTVNTRCLDRAAAKQVLRRCEREAQSPNREPGHTPHTVEEALRMLIEHAGEDVSEGTVDMWRVKGGHLFRLMGDRDINGLHFDHVQGYIDERLKEGAARTTVRKELSTLSRALDHAELRGMRPRGSPSPIPKFRAKYVPKTRHLSTDEFRKLWPQLSFDRKFWLLLAAYSGGRFSEIERLTWENVDKGMTRLQLPGTKTNKARRWVPIATVLKLALEELGRGAGRIVKPWANVRRDLAVACRKAGIDKVTPNDLRRTFASWMKNAGVDSKVVANLLGHSTTRMVDLVYGHLDDVTHDKAIKKLPGAKQVGACSVFVADSGQQQGHLGRMGKAGSPKTPENQPLAVPRGGIEPPTRGFSVLGQRREKPTLQVVPVKTKRSL